MRHLLMLLLLLIYYSDCLGKQLPDSLKGKPKLFLERFDTLINVKVSLNNDYEKLENTGRDFYLDLRPNIAVATRFTFDYKFISFSFGFTPRFLPGNNDLQMKGSTKNLSLGTQLHLNHWIQDFEVSGVKGFYVANTKDYNSSWEEGDSYIKLPGLSVISFRGMTTYKFNSNFSVKAVTSQTEVQRASCGSFMASLGYNYYVIDRPKSIVGAGLVQRNYDLIAIGSYSYTFVFFKRFYLSLMQAFGGGMAHVRLATELSNDWSVVRSFQAVAYGNSSINLGYGGRRLYGGLGSNVVFTSQMLSGSTQIDKSRGYYHFFIGYRFHAPSLLRKTITGVERLLNL